ncbi:MAG: CHASE domain-containing protein [Bacteroidales bacterium]|nr:CHASE domain-containing protein [Bacteroidales bacterium]
MKQIKLKNRIQKILPFLIALFSFSILTIMALSYSNYKKDYWEKDVKTRLLETLMTKKTSLERALYSRVYYTKSVAAYVSLRPDISTSEFYNLAAELIKNDSVISTMALAKDCIIDAIFPKKGHEAAIGLNLLAHPKRREIVEKTIETQKTFVAGPVQLVEGGIAFISYTPIFDKTKPKGSNFWGVTDIVIRRDKLLEETSLLEREAGFLFSIRGYDGKGDQGDIWWGNESVFTKNPVTVNIDLPYGNWVLAAVPEIGWSSYLNQDHVLLYFLLLSTFIISVLIWFISRSIIKIKENEQELRAIFHSLNSLIIEYDEEGRYIKIPTSNTALLIRPKEEMLQKTISDIFNKEEADFFHSAIKKCLKTKNLVQIEYSLQIGADKKWFATRISWKSEHRVIFHAVDITEQKNAREKIIESEKRLKALNATKDKLFSIIAHDLKSPFNIILGYSDLLKSEYKQFEPHQRTKLINNIYESSKNAFNLVENLLLWANSQSDNIKLSKESLNLKKLIIESIEAHQFAAENKNITIEINVPPQLNINADKFTLQTIIANLFNNAIKFTYAKGKIIIDVKQIEGAVEICITDNGIGISEEVLPKLFQVNDNISTLGTENEKGTGLGLLLCKEFVEKYNGKIWAESEPEKGSKFCFTIPISKG